MDLSIKISNLYKEYNLGLVGNKTWRKTIWLCFFFLSQGFTRTPKVKNTKLMDAWVAANISTVNPTTIQKSSKTSWAAYRWGASFATAKLAQ